MMEWQLIETAPKDGTDIIAAWDRSKSVLIAYYDCRKWFDSSDDAELSQPTHWMPLPRSP